MQDTKDDSFLNELAGKKRDKIASRGIENDERLILESENSNGSHHISSIMQKIAKKHQEDDSDGKTQVTIRIKHKNYLALKKQATSLGITVNKLAMETIEEIFQPK